MFYDLRVKDEAEVVSETLEKRISVNGLCPHCEHEKFQRWGKTNSVQRSRCKSCLKTFNTVTGTPLAHLRKKGECLKYSEAMIEGLSVRKAAKKCEVHQATSFRWRHRFMHILKDRKDFSHKGIVEADEIFFLESFKGSRKLPHAARIRGDRAAKSGLLEEQISVLIARNRHGEMNDGVLSDLSQVSVT